MPWPTCGAALAGAAGYLPCAAWLWPDDDGEQLEPMLQPPTQTLDECLIPPAQPDLYARLPSEQSTAAGGTWDGSSQPTLKRPESAESARPKPGRIRPKRALQPTPKKAGDESSGGIELKEAGTNLLLGQFHRDQGGQFVKAQLGRQKLQRGGSKQDADLETDLNPRTPDLQQESRSPSQGRQEHELVS